jgi:hypothetical protein
MLTDGLRYSSSVPLPLDLFGAKSWPLWGNERTLEIEANRWYSYARFPSVRKRGQELRFELNAAPIVFSP